jgi:phosphoribosylformylglycinamidine cyclo-ligase
MAKQTTYADSGVNIELGDDASKILYNAAKETWKNRKGKLGEVIVPTDDFTGVRAIDVSNLPRGTLMNIGFDGVGTKVEIAEGLGNHRTVAYDLIAMVCDDAVVRGAEPVLLGSVLDVNSLGTTERPFINEVRQLAEGYIAAAKEANVAIVNGEVAELGSRVSGVGPFNYNWAAGVVWFAKKERMFTGNEIREGDCLVGLKEEGFRSNGISLVRKIMKTNHGDKWYGLQWKNGNSTFGEQALTPSRIYTAAAVEMFGGYNGMEKAEVHGIVNVTGGGVPGKVGRILKPSGLGAFIGDPFEPPEFMEHVQLLGGVSDIEAYRTWNMGQGMIVITQKPNGVMDIASKYGIEAKKIGMVVKTPGITLMNRGAFCPDKFSETGTFPRGERFLTF